MNNVRPAAVAGSFYPADAHALRAMVQGHLAAASNADAAAAPPKMLVVPHAGYVYSGAVAALAERGLAEAGLRGLEVPDTQAARQRRVLALFSQGQGGVQAAEEGAGVRG